MKSKKSSHRRKPEFVTLDDLEAWLSCRLRWKLTQDPPTDAELPPWEHLQKCILESVFFYHRERARLGKVYYARVQEFFWESFERQSLAVSQGYAPGERARDMRSGEGVLKAYVIESNARTTDCLGHGLTWPLSEPGARLALHVRADLLYPGIKPVRLQVVKTIPDPELTRFHLAPWAAAIAAALTAQHGRPPQRLEALYLVANEPAQVVRVTIPPAPTETMDKLRLWLIAYTRGLAQGEVFPQPGSHCGHCPFRAPCARWPVKTK